MKRTFAIISSMIVLAMLLSGCEKPLWMTMPDPSGKPAGEEPVTDWSGVADSCTFVLVDNFLDKERGVFWTTPDNVQPANNIYWQQAHAMDVLVYSYERIKDTDPALAEEYIGYFRKWYASDGGNYNDSHDSEGEYGAGGFFNAFTDDMCWICLTLLHMSEATGDDTYADTAREIYDNYIITRVWTGEEGLTGLPWQNNDAENARNACTNAPGCLVAARLYQKYGVEAYLDDAVMLYDYVEGNLLYDDGRVEEPPLSYTQGTFGEACRQLYDITGERKYLRKADAVLLYAMTSGRCTNNGLLRDEGTSMDQSIFKAVLIPYVVNYIMYDKATVSTKDRLYELLMDNAEALDASLDRTLFPQMYANYYWGTPFSGGVASMGAQTSGASLMEGVARLEKFLNENAD
ncbi:MAG: alpha-1,6-mannanase [Bacteroidetes bacterium]|uniref:Alpha-1,6-mannanase n=1 Tax=Candidatus Cryptobacteroides avicola TaxID=2840757 RepID=A0A940DRQ7_9BACT|nr:alpha-1,6-mannanase [Candidatus Cryptobacteroides avicola]